MITPIEVFISVRPTPAVDEANGSGSFWVVLDALVKEDDVEEYIARSKFATELDFKFISGSAGKSLRAVPLPDDVDLSIVLSHQSCGDISRQIPRRTAFKFLDRAGFLAANRSATWAYNGKSDDYLDDLDPLADGTPAFRNEALRQVLIRAPQTGESDSFKAFLLRSTGLGASRIISNATFDTNGLDDYLMLFDDGLGAGVWRTNQHSLDGQLARFPLQADDPHELKVNIYNDVLNYELKETLSSGEKARLATLTTFLSSPKPVPEVTVSLDATVPRRLYAHGRWENGVGIGESVYRFSRVTADTGSGGRSVLRVIGDATAKWDIDKFATISFATYRSATGRLRPYRGTAKATNTDNKLWFFDPETPADGDVGRLLVDSDLDYVLDASGVFLFDKNNAALPLKRVGVYDFPWEGSLDSPKPLLIFWSALTEVAPGIVTLVISGGYGGGYLTRRSRHLSGDLRYWQSDDDYGGSVSEAADCVIFTDADGSPLPPQMAAQILRLSAVDFELANSAQKFEARLTSYSHAPRILTSNAKANVSAARPGFGSFNGYNPIFEWTTSKMSRAPFEPTPDVQINPISTEWPADLKTSTYHVSFRQDAWENVPLSDFGDIANDLYSGLGQQFRVAHCFNNPLGQRLLAEDSGGPVFTFCHFAPVLRVADIRFVGSAGSDLRFLTVQFDENTQELVLAANFDILNDTVSANGKVAAWMAYKCLAELANASDIYLAVSYYGFDNSGVLAADENTVPPVSVLVPLPWDDWNETISLNGTRSSFRTWLHKPPKGLVEVGRYPVRKKNGTARLTDVAHAIRFSLSVSREPSTCPDNNPSNYSLQPTYRPEYNIIDTSTPNPQPNDAALLILASSWLESIRSQTKLFSSPATQLLSLSALASTYGDEAPEFLWHFAAPPTPAQGEIVGTMVPIAVRPLARQSQLSLVTARSVSRLFTLVSTTIDCSVPSWWAKWGVDDWQALFASMPSRNPNSTTAFDAILDALIDAIAPVPSGASQASDSHVPVLLGELGGRIAIRTSRLRRQFKTLLWGRLDHADRSCFAAYSVFPKDLSIDVLPTDLWRLSVAARESGSSESEIITTLDVTDISRGLRLGRGSLTALIALNRLNFRKAVSFDRPSVFRGAAATNPNATGPNAFVSVDRVELPGGVDDFSTGSVRVAVPLPPTTAFVSPRLLSVARCNLDPAASNLFPPPGQRLSREALESSKVIPATAGDLCLILAAEQVGTRSQRFDTSFRVATLRVALDSDEIENVCFEILLQPPSASDPIRLFDEQQTKLFFELAGDAPIETIDEVAGLAPMQPGSYLYYADQSLGELIKAADPYTPMPDQQKMSIRIERTPGGSRLRLDAANPILWAEVALCSTNETDIADEFYLTLVLQLPVWNQEPLWFRQSRGLPQDDRIGPEFIDHDTVSLKGLAETAYSSVSYTHSSLRTAPIPEIGRQFSPDLLVVRLLDTEAVEGVDWTNYDAKIVTSHRMSPTFPTVDASGVNRDSGVRIFDPDAAFPVFSVHVAAGSWSVPTSFPAGYGLQVLDITWFTRDSLRPFFEVKGRPFMLAPA